MTGQLTPTQLDREIRRRLDGARLVCEVNWPEDLLFAAKKDWAFTNRAKSEFAREYPGTAVLFLVTWGVTHYKENEFWTDLHLGPDHNRVGAAFEAALPVLGLETFPQFGGPGSPARRFVAPILAHGGIPESLASSFFTQVLFPALRAGHGSTGAELVARWRRDPPPGLRTTVGRFLLFGGKTGVDLLDRLIGLASIPRPELEASAAAGVPAHLLRAFLAVPPAQVPKPRPTLPRPTVELDPWADEGPVVRLPALVREVGEGVTWEVVDGSGATRTERAHPRRDLAPLPLFPAKQWEVRARRGADLLFERTFEALGDTAMVCFDTSRAYVADVEGVKADRLWVVTPADVRLASAEAAVNRPLDGEEARFFGAWAKHRATLVDLSSVDVLVALRHDKEVGRVPVLRAAGARPSFAGTAIAGVVSQEGLDVRAALPDLVLPSGSAWTVRLTGPADRSGTASIAPSDLPTTIRLADLVDDAPMGRWEVRATGALGTDFPAAFALVPGLALDAPSSPLTPDAGDVTVTATASREVEFPGRLLSGPYAETVPATDTHAEIWAFPHARGHKVGLLVTIPRIRWAFREGTAGPPLDTRVLAFAPEDLGTGLPDLIVAVGRGDVPVRLLLENGEGERLVLAGSGRTSPDGMVRFDLAGIRDTARAMASEGLRLALYAGDASIVVGYHLPARTTAPAQTGGQNGLFGRDVEVTVLTIEHAALIVAGGDWEGIIYDSRLPRPLESYAVGDRLIAHVLSIGDRVKLDARAFDPTAFRLGDLVTGTVVRPTGDGLLVSARGHDLLVGVQRLPPNRPASSWRPGEEITGKVVSINVPERRIRLSVAPFDPGGLRPGDTVEGEVYHAGEVIYVLVNHLVGYIRSGDRPPDEVRPGQRLRARVTRIDHLRDQIDLTCRSFNAGGLARGDTVLATVTGIRDEDGFVRLPGGETGWMALDDDERHDEVAAIGIGGELRVVITSIDQERSRIAVRPADSRRRGPEFSAGDSPFAKLAALQLGG